ncbi:MAG TPA: pirin family protein [bacterium]|jgi:redox-sensitive bicupin YhaK (pirin superfamily)|nr:pirin family protein [bacterium]
MAIEKNRKITQIIRGMDTSDGAGVKLKRILGSPELNMLDPFLLLDEFKNDNPDDYAAGFPDHPHRGFETITYMMAGSFTHRDSKGHEGHLTAGSIQWMTAGKGLIHSEMPEQTDGLAWGYQLWLNLPAKLKMTEPKYQDISSEKLPVFEKDGRKVKVLAGEYEGAKSPGQSFIPFTYLDVRLNPGAVFSLSAPADQNAFLYVIEGKAKTGSQEEPSYVKAGYLGVFGEGDSVKIEPAEEKPLHFLFASAQKLNEPVARGGPFVMNTVGEVKKAFADYQTGNLG